MFINQGRNRSMLFIRRTVFIPSPTGMMLAGVKTEGVSMNIPYIELDFSGQGLSSVDANAVLQDTDANYVAELTWRVLDLSGNDPMTDEASYDSLINKGWTIYGDTEFDIYQLRFKALNSDHIDYGAGSTMIDFADFEIEIEYSDYLLTISGAKNIIGRSSNAVSPTGEWGLLINSFLLQFYFKTATGVFSVSAPEVTEGIILIKGSNDGVNYTLEMFIDDVLVDTDTGLLADVPSENTLYHFMIAAGNRLAGNPVEFFNGTIHWAKITSFGVTNIINIEEGSGNTTTSSEGDVGIIKTSNPYPTYIDDTMWRGIPVGSLNFDRANQDYVDFGTGKAWIDPNDFTLEVKISDFVKDLSNHIGSSIIGQFDTETLPVNASWQLYHRSYISEDFFRFIVYEGSNLFTLDFPNITEGVIRVIGSNRDYEIFVDDVSVASGTASFDITISPLVPMRIASVQEWGDGSYFTGTVHWAKITSFGVTNIINIEEGSGNTTTSSQGDIGTIKTSNPLGQTYIDDTMWE